MGHPGTLPVPNATALDMAIKTILALDGTVNEHSKFDRKHYFYPDLPKGYQISQYDQPIGSGGHLDISVDKTERRIHLTRVHIEEDAAKLTHEVSHTSSYVDFNRAGTPLIEIVTEPDFRSPHEAKTFLHNLHLLLRYLNVSDGDMEKGQLRCDANVSLRPVGIPKFFPKTEIKNMNSFRAVERALEYEIQRQTKLWEEDKRPSGHATRGWNDTKQETIEQRTKEEAHDYRYIPEPDIPPLLFTSDIISNLRKTLPELPANKLKRFEDEYAMDNADARIIIEDRAMANWTEHVLSELQVWISAIESEKTEEEKWATDKRKLVKLVTGWITSKLFALMNEKNIKADALPITAENYAEFITLIYERTINSTTAQEVLRAMVETGVDPSSYIDERGLKQIQDTNTVETIIKNVIDNSTTVVATFKSGKEGALQFLVGQVMKETKGRADPIAVQDMLKKLLSHS